MNANDEGTVNSIEVVQLTSAPLIKEKWEEIDRDGASLSLARSEMGVAVRDRQIRRRNNHLLSVFLPRTHAVGSTKERGEG